MPPVACHSAVINVIGMVSSSAKTVSSANRSCSAAVSRLLLAWIVAVVEVYLGPIQWLCQHAPGPAAHIFAANEYRIFLFAYILVTCPLTLAALALHEELFGGHYARLAFLGDISYSVYLVHFPALFVTLAVFNSRHVGLFSPYPRALGFLLSAALVIAVSAATFRWVERPFLRRAAVTAA